MNKKLLVSLGLASTLTFSSMVSYAAVFSDIQGHWAEKTIEWGKANGYVSGYQDGSFQPDKQVTEAEFATMLIATFHLKLDPVAQPKHWADEFYQYAKTMNYPLSYDNVDARNLPISRSRVAELVSSVQGQNLTGEEAVKYLLVNGLSGGKTSATVDGFAGSDNLTRAEAISFIQKMLDKGQITPQTRPSSPTDTAKVDQQYQDLVKQQQASQTSTATETTTWTPGPVRVVADQLFPSYKDNGDSVTVTMPTVDGYGFVAVYATYGVKPGDPNYKSMVLKQGQTYTFQKGFGGQVGVSIQGDSHSSSVEDYLIRIDSATVNPAGLHQWIPMESILKGLGVN